MRENRSLKPLLPLNPPSYMCRNARACVAKRTRGCAGNSFLLKTATAFHRVASASYYVTLPKRIATRPLGARARVRQAYTVCACVDPTQNAPALRLHVESTNVAVTSVRSCLIESLGATHLSPQQTYVPYTIVISTYLTQTQPTFQTTSFTSTEAFAILFLRM